VENLRVVQPFLLITLLLVAAVEVAVYMARPRGVRGDTVLQQVFL
jgi:hypothetical protein